MAPSIDEERGYETIKLNDREYDSWELTKKLDEALAYFETSPVSTPDLKLFNQLINMLWKKRNFKPALAAVRKAREKYTGDVDLEEKEAEILLDGKHLQEAIERFQDLHERYPRRYHILVGLADALQKNKQFEESEDVLIDALELETWDPTFLMSRFEMAEMLAMCYFVQEEYERARELLESILTIQPRTQKWELYFEVLRALKDINKLAEAEVTFNRIKMAKRYASRAAKYEEQKKHEQALKNYRKAIEINPFEPHYYFSVGSVLEGLPENEYQFQFDEATAYYRTACELFPNNLFYWMSFIGNLTNVNEWDKAFEQAKEAAKKFPELMLPNLRYLSNVLGLEDQYLDLLRELVELDNYEELSEIRTELAVLLKDRREPGYEKWFRAAASIYRNKIDTEPYNWRHYFDYACCMIELEMHEEARVPLIKALEYHQAFRVDIAERLADTEMKLGHYKDARLALEALVLLNPKDYDYLGKMGLCFLMEADYDRGFEAFNRSILLNHYVPEYLYGAGVCAAHLGREQDVVNIIKDLLQMNDSFIEIIEDEPAFKPFFKQSQAFTTVMDTSKQKREERVEKQEQKDLPIIKPVTPTKPMMMRPGVALKKIEISKKDGK